MTARAVVLATAVALAVGVPGTPRAQELSQRTSDRCVRAAVKIVSLGPDGRGGTTGTGSIIDPRGYVLTNFHVVGHRGPDRGTPGTLINPRNRVQISTVDSARDTARPRWEGAVVRGDARLDLALVRILTDTDGNEVRGASFTTVPIGDSAQLRPGTPVWAFGYPLGVRTINVTGGHVTGFEMNARDEVAWIRSDAEFNPGNSGGMLVDGRGRLVGIPTIVVRGGDTLEPVELARPPERIPSEWLRSLREGHIDDVRITGVHALRAGEPIDEAIVGDGGSIGGPELIFYLLPPDRPGVLRLSRPLPVMLGSERGRLLRRGRGSVEVRADDGDALLAAIPFEAPEQTVRFSVRYDHTPPVEDEPAAPPAQVAPATPEPPLEALDPPSPLAELPARPSPPPSDAPVSTLRGAIVDAVSGRPVQGLMVVGRPGLDIRAHMTAFMSGQLTEAQLRGSLVGWARSDVGGRYEVTGVPRNQTYPGAAVAPGYRPAFLLVTVADEGAVISMNAIQMTR